MVETVGVEPIHNGSSREHQGTVGSLVSLEFQRFKALSLAITAFQRFVLFTESDSDSASNGKAVTPYCHRPSVEIRIVYMHEDMKEENEKPMKIEPFPCIYIT